jgi:hypothetical protein
MAVNLKALVYAADGANYRTWFLRSERATFAVVTGYSQIYERITKT